MASFQTRLVNYLENRADGGFAWNVRYDLSFLYGTATTTLRVDLVGANPGATQAVWQTGVNAIWNERVLFNSGNKLHEWKLDFKFVETNEHQTVTAHAGSGRTNMTNWYLNDAWGPSYYDEVAAHEVGHMLGAFDEYSGGATLNGVVRTGTLMSNLTQSGFQRYFTGIEKYLELYSGQKFTLVLAKRGTDSSETLNGSNGLNGIYGMKGNDVINGLGGNDLLNGGIGNDQLFGGIGNDTLIGRSGKDLLNGGTGADRFEFAAKTDSVVGVNRDTIADFKRTQGDRIDLSKIDADTDGTAGNQAFIYIASRAFGGVDGQLRFAGAVLQGDLNGDRKADFEIKVTGITLIAADFIL